MGGSLNDGEDGDTMVVSGPLSMTHAHHSFIGNRKSHARMNSILAPCVVIIGPRGH